MLFHAAIVREILVIFLVVCIFVAFGYGGLNLGGWRDFWIWAGRLRAGGRVLALWALGTVLCMEHAYRLEHECSYA